MVEKLIITSHTSHAMKIINQYMQAPRTCHMEVVKEFLYNSYGHLNIVDYIDADYSPFVRD